MGHKPVWKCTFRYGHGSGTITTATPTAADRMPAKLAKVRITHPQTEIQDNCTCSILRVIAAFLDFFSLLFPFTLDDDDNVDDDDADDDDNNDSNK